MADLNNSKYNWIDELKTRADIYSVVASYVSLSRKGQRMWACCPFHAERTPSFAIDTLRGTWTCFGACHEGGDVISFEMKINNLSFFEACQRLASKVGMTLPSDFTKSDSDKATEREKKMMVETAKFYRENLRADKNVQEYLKSRNVSEKTIQQFGLGFSKDSSSLIRHLKSLGFKEKEMLEYGLLAERDGRFYDFLTGRLIVPIFDPFGNVIAFGGRILKKPQGDVQVAKYKNTRETKLFVKNKTLYGMNFVRKARVGNPINDIIIVEGYMDVIGLHQAGFKNVVASMGTSLTDNQAKLIRNMVDTVYICYDGDFAGQNSTLRGLRILKAHDLDVRIMTMPDGLDPDELVANGPEPFNKLKEDAKSLYDYLLWRAEDGLNLNTKEGKNEYAKRAIAIINEIPKIERNAYVELLWQKTGIPITTIFANLTDEKKVVDSKEDSTVSPKLVSDAYTRAGRFVLNSLVVKEELFSEELSKFIFTNDTHKIIYDYIVDCLARGRKPIPSTAYLLEGVSGEEVSEILNTNVDIPDSNAYYNDCVNKLLMKYYKERKIVITALLKKAFDDDERNKLQQELKFIVGKIAKLK